MGKVLKKYSVELIEGDDGEIYYRRTNEGFNSYELYGLVSHAKLEIMKQINGNLKPKMERVVKKEYKSEDEILKDINIVASSKRKL